MQCSDKNRSIIATRAYRINPTFLGGLMALWFRFYQSALDDPRVQRLPGDTFKAWVNLLCLTSKSGGVLPPIEDIAFSLRTTELEADLVIQQLLKAQLLERKGGALVPVDWHDRQFLDKTNAQRQRAFRDRKKARNALHNGNDNTLHNGPVTSQDREGEEEGDSDKSPIQGRMLVNSKSRDIGEYPWS